MKNNSQPNPILLRLMVLVTCFMLVMLYNKSKAAIPNSTFKKATVVFSQDIVNNELKVLVKSDINNSMELYFYSTQKKLVKEISINSHHELIIKDMKKGTYLYKFLCNNLNVNNGTLVIK